MAVETLYSGAVLAGTMPDGNVPAGITLSRTETYTADGASDANSVVQMIPIPKYAQIIDLQVFIADAGAARTCDIGDADLVDRYFDGLDVASGPIRKSLVADGDAAYIAPYEYTADDTIDVKWIGDTLEDGQIITLTVSYTMGATIDDD